MKINYVKKIFVNFIIYSLTTILLPLSFIACESNGTKGTNEDTPHEDLSNLPIEDASTLSDGVSEQGLLIFDGETVIDTKVYSENLVESSLTHDQCAFYRISIVYSKGSSEIGLIIIDENYDSFYVVVKNHLVDVYGEFEVNTDDTFSKTYQTNKIPKNIKTFLQDYNLYDYTPEDATSFTLSEQCLFPDQTYQVSFPEHRIPVPGPDNPDGEFTIEYLISYPAHLE